MGTEAFALVSAARGEAPLEDFMRRSPESLLAMVMKTAHVATDPSKFDGDGDWYIPEDFVNSLVIIFEGCFALATAFEFKVIAREGDSVTFRAKRRPDPSLPKPTAKAPAAGKKPPRSPRKNHLRVVDPPPAGSPPAPPTDKP